MRRNGSHRRGYVLVLTLGLIALVAMSLAGLARYSLDLASNTQDAAEELQRRWGILSTRHIFLGQAAEILDAQVRTTESGIPPWPKPASVATSFNLGSQKFTVIISDEDAKVNLNTIHRHSPEQLLSAVRRLGQDAGGLNVRPTADKTARAAFNSWGQVFDLARVPPDRDVTKMLGSARRNMTCWSSGRLNLRRASDSAIHEVASLALSSKDASELVSLRKTWSGQSVDDLLSQLELTRNKQSLASRLFSVESRAYSLWVEIDNGQRKWTFEYVDDGGPVCFAW